jgi:hypothetical protein
MLSFLRRLFKFRFPPEIRRLEGTYMDQDRIHVPKEVEWKRAEEFVAGVSDGSIRPKVVELEEELADPVTQVYKKE